MKMFVCNFRSLLVAGLCLCVLVSCETAQDVWLDNMQGTLDYSTPTTMGINQKVKFTAGGIVTPSQGIVYEWQAPGFNPSSGTGETFEAFTPDTAGDYSIVVTARATGFREINFKKPLTVLSCITLSDALNFFVPVQVAAGQPVTFAASGMDNETEAVTYKWHAPQFTPGSATGSTFTPTSPGSTGDYPVTLSAVPENTNFCPIVVEDTVHVVTGKTMGANASLKVLAPDTVYAGDPVTFAADFTADPDHSPTEVNYTWQCPNCETNTSSTGEYFSTKVPFTHPGQYSVILTASADGYLPITKTYEFTTHLRTMDAGKGFIVSPGTMVATSKAMEFKATPPTGVANVTYAWSFLGGFSGISGTTSDRAAATSPNTLTATPSVTLTMSAPGYQDGIYEQSITLSNCEKMPAPVITSPDNNQLLSNQNFTFTIANADQLPNITVYKWEFLTPGFTPSSATTAGFSTKAPVYNGATYMLQLQVTTDNVAFCSLSDVVTLPISVKQPTGVLSGQVSISEEVPAEDINPGYRAAHPGVYNKPSIWLARNRPVTLTASYKRGGGEDAVVPKYEWFLGDENTPLSGTTSSDGSSISFTPTDAIERSKIIVRVSDTSPSNLASTRTEFAYDVQNCEFPTTKKGLLININYQCKTGGSPNQNWEAYTVDAEKNIYKTVSIGTQWWMAENYRRNIGANLSTYKDVYGLYYQYDATIMTSADGAFCPEGWKVPAAGDVSTLFAAISNSAYALRTTTSNGTQVPPDVRWENREGTNLYNFSAIPAGYSSNGMTLSSISILARLLAQSAYIEIENGVVGISSSAHTPTHYYTVRCVLD